MFFAMGDATIARHGHHGLQLGAVQLLVVGVGDRRVEVIVKVSTGSSSKKRMS